MTATVAKVFVRAIDQFSAPFQKMGVAAFGAHRRMEGFNRSARNVGRASMGVNGLGATMLGGAMVKRQYDFEYWLNKTQATLDMVNKKGMQPLRDNVVKLAGKYPAMRTEITKGAFEMSQAGMTLTDINTIMEQAIQGSMAAGESIQTVSAGVTDVIFGYGMAFDTAKEKIDSFRKVNNFLAAGATVANQTYTKYLDGLAKTAPVAKALGVPMGVLVAAHGALANAAIKGAKGGTALRTMMIKAVAPTEKARKLMRGLGIDISKFTKLDKSINFKATGLNKVLLNDFGKGFMGLGDNMQKHINAILNNPALKNNLGLMGDKLTSVLSKALDVAPGDLESHKKLSDTIRLYLASATKGLDLAGLFGELAKKNASPELLKELFGLRHIEKAMTLIEQMASGKFDKLYRKLMAKAPGAVKRFADIMTGGFVGAWLGFASKVDQLMDSGMSQVTDTLAEALASVGNFIIYLNELNPNILKVATYAILASAALAPIGFVLSGFGSILGFVVPIVWFLGKGAFMLGGALLSLTPAIASAAAGFGALLLATWPITVPLAMIAGAGYLIYKNWEKVAPFLSKLGKAFIDLHIAVGKFGIEVFNFIKTNLGKAFDWALDKINLISTKIANFMSILTGMPGKAFDALKNFMPDINFSWDNLLSGASDVFESFYNSFSTFGNGIVEYLKSNVGKVFDWISKKINLISTKIANFISTLTGMPGKVFDALKNFMPDINFSWDNLLSGASDVFESFYNSFSTFGNGIVEYLKSNVGKVFDWISKKINLISTKITNFISTLTGMPGKAFDKLKSFIPDFQMQWGETPPTEYGIVKQVDVPQQRREMIRDYAPAAGSQNLNLDVTGKVKSEVSGKVSGKIDNEIHIKIDGPGKVVKQISNGGIVTGEINTGKSMSDIGSGR